MLTLLSPRAGAVLALIVANVVWGTTFVATKPMLERVPPLTVATARFAIALAILWPLVIYTGRRPVLGRVPAMMGFIGVFLVYVCQNVGLQYTSATNGALIHGGVPILAVLLAVPLLSERPTRTRVVGIVASLIGVAAVVGIGPGADAGVSALGDALVLVSALALAGYVVIARHAFAGHDPVALTAGVALYGLLFLLPVGSAELVIGKMARPTVTDLLGLLYLGAGASALAFVLWGYGLRHLDASQAAVFVNFSPLVGVVAAAAFLGEPIAAVQLGGGALIIAGVCLTTSSHASVSQRRVAGSADVATIDDSGPRLAPSEAVPGAAIP